MSGLRDAAGLLALSRFNTATRATFKFLQMAVLEFVTGARLPIVRPSDPLAEGYLNNCPV